MSDLSIFVKTIKVYVFMAAILDLAPFWKMTAKKTGNIDFLFLCSKSFDLMHNMHYLPKNSTELHLDFEHISQGSYVERKSFRGNFWKKIGNIGLYQFEAGTWASRKMLNPNYLVSYYGRVSVS